MSNPDWEHEVDPELFMSPELQEVTRDIDIQVACYNPLGDFEMNGLGNRLPEHTSSVIDPHSINPELRQSTAATYVNALQRLRPFTKKECSSRDRQIADRLTMELTVRQGLLENTAWRRPLDHTYASFPLRMGLDESGEGKYELESAADFDLAQTRYRSFPEWVDKAIENMHEGIVHGDTQVRIVMEVALEQLGGLISGDVHQFVKPLCKLADGRMYGLKGRLTFDDYNKHEATVTEVLLPAYEKLYSFVKHTYLSRCRGNARVGMWALPNGDQQYLNLVRYYAYDNDATVQSVIAIIEEEWRKTIAALEAVKAQTNMRNAKLCDFLKRLDNPDWELQTPRWIEAKFKDQDVAIQANLHRIFNQVPKAAFEINIDTSPGAAANAPSYSMPSHNGRHPGRFNLPLNGCYPGLAVLRLSLHEGRAGHHQQLAWQQELGARTLPSLLRSCTPALTFVEGYAMYAESLAHDLQIEETPWQVGRRLRTYAHVLRMSRLDLGVNGERWDLATAQVRQREMFADDHSEILRAIAWPGQASAYSIGRRWFKALRAEAEAALGSAFDLRSFHGAVLNDGARSYAVLREDVEAWIRSQQVAKQPPKWAR